MRISAVATAVHCSSETTDSSRIMQPIQGIAHVQPTVAPTLVSIEGNIGVGKSTLLASLTVLFKSDAASVVFVTEPVHEWEEHGLLEALYSGTISGAVFQMMVLATRFRCLNAALRLPGVKIVVAERSLFSDQIFADVNLSGIDLVAYRTAWRANVDSLPDFKLCVLLIDLPPSALQNRIRLRGRKSEEAGTALTEAYLERLDKAHEKYYDGLPLDVEKLRIQGCKDKNQIAMAADNLIRRLLEEHSTATPKQKCHWAW